MSSQVARIPNAFTPITGHCSSHWPLVVAHVEADGCRVSLEHFPAKGLRRVFGPSLCRCVFLGFPRRFLLGISLENACLGTNSWQVFPFSAAAALAGETTANFRQPPCRLSRNKRISKVFRGRFSPFRWVSVRGACAPCRRLRFALEIPSV